MIVPNKLKEITLKSDLESQGNNVDNFTPGFELSDIKLFSYGSRPCLKNESQVYRMCCRHLNWGLPNRDIFQVLVFSFHRLYLTTATGVWERNEIQKGKGHSLLLSYASGLTSAWHEHWTDHPSCPETWLHAALKQVFGCMFLFRLSQESPLAEDPRTIFPKNTGRVFWHLLRAG